MKKLQFAAWMMLMLIGFSFNACVSGTDEDDEDNFITQLMLARFDDSSVTNTCFYDINGTQVIPTQPLVLYSLTNGIYQFTVSYNPNTLSGGKVTVNLNSEPTSIMNRFGLLTASTAEEAYLLNDNSLPLYAINYTQRNLQPFMFDKDYLIVPFVFHAPSMVDDNEYQKELLKHTFRLVLDYSTIEEQTPVLYLSDTVTDPDLPRSQTYYTFQAFNIRSLVNTFKAGSRSFDHIILKAMVNTNNTEMNNAREETFTIDYKFDN